MLDITLFRKEHLAVFNTLDSFDFRDVRFRIDIVIYIKQNYIALFKYENNWRLYTH